ncbi:MAG: hypothetical protein GF315_11960, partial [candidate division Zixibacteria bacterium]|nr:hypothetical protein [candidate division Zixibacteria bacterium]
MKRFMTSRMLVVLSIIAVIVIGSNGLLNAAIDRSAIDMSASSDATMKPRYIPSKPANTVLKEWHDRNRIKVKFVDNLDIGLNNQGEPVDR